MIQGRRFIAIAGNIGAGKSSLAALLAKRHHYLVAPEPVGENPFLEDFYGDMSRWGFHSQIFFLSHRINQHLDIAATAQPTIQDRSLYEDAEIFARNLHLQGTLSDREYQTYFNLYQTVQKVLKAPDLVIYLRASVPTLKRRIVQRGRPYEQALPADYLAGLNDLYEAWAQSFRAAPVVSIDVDKLDFVNREADLETILAAISC